MRFLILAFLLSLLGCAVTIKHLPVVHIDGDVYEVKILRGEP